MPDPRPEDIFDEIERTFDELIAQQRKKVHRLALELKPGLAPDDLMNPQDFPEVYGDAIYQYEDGILNGFVAAQIALRARVARRFLPAPPPPASPPPPA